MHCVGVCGVPATANCNVLRVESVRSLDCDVMLLSVWRLLITAALVRAVFSPLNLNRKFWSPCFFHRLLDGRLGQILVRRR